MAKTTKTQVAKAAEPVVAVAAPVATEASTFSDILVGPLQLRVLHVLWERPDRSGTVSDVHVALNSQGRPALAYTTVLTVMRNLARRKVVAQIPGGRQHIFRVFDDRKAYEAKLVQVIISDLFNGDKARLLTLVKA